MKVGHMVSKRFWDNSNRSITDGEMLEIEPRVNGQPLWSTTVEQRERNGHVAVDRLDVRQRVGLLDFVPDLPLLLGALVVAAGGLGVLGAARERDGDLGAHRAELLDEAFPAF